jgi:hypothetical protein
LTNQVFDFCEFPRLGAAVRRPQRRGAGQRFGLSSVGVQFALWDRW